MDLKAGIIAGQRRALAKAITLIESTHPDHQAQSETLLNAILPHTGKSIRIGITGVPGVGKSTFIEAFGLHLIEQGHKVAVLAVDPSSPLKGGSLLGDKTRMEHLSRKSEAFIRPSPSDCAMGGVTRVTREAILLCEAAGYDVILIETVGVGQSEYEVASMVDFFTVLMLPNAGDELQGIKRGIMELADLLIVNKADGANESAASTTQSQYQSALKLMQNTLPWESTVLKCSARENTGIAELWQHIQALKSQSIESGFFEQRRAQQQEVWLEALIQHMLLKELEQREGFAQSITAAKEAIRNQQLTPFAAAKNVVLDKD